MIVHTPWADDLRLAPELAILAALEAALATTIEVMAVAHPCLRADGLDSDGDALAPVTVAAITLSRRAAELVAVVNRYRLAIFDF